MPFAGGRLAFSTDSFVVRPLFFPGGSIGDLAVNGTVNDLAMSGASPLFLSTAFILEEGTDITVVGAISKRLGEAAVRAGVRIVTGDTKVVESGTVTGFTSTRLVSASYRTEWRSAPTARGRATSSLSAVTSACTASRS